MKINRSHHISLLFYCLVLLTTCTIYNEEINFSTQNFETLTPLSIATDLKVINLEVEQTEFDDMYLNFEEEIEIDAILSLYKNHESLIENEKVEIKIKGSFSASFELKSLGIKFDKAFDNSNHELIDTEVLPFHSINKIKSFRLRNSGNDFKLTMLKDMSLTKLAIEAQLDLDVMYSEQAVVFLNDAFLGIMNIRTEVNAHGLSRLYGKNKEDVTLLSISEGGVIEKKDGDFDRIDSFFEAIENENIELLYKEIDIPNFIDYIIYETYIGNIDWPLNNVRVFAIDDQPFRFVLFDLDMAIIQKTNAPPLNFIIEPINDNESNPITTLFKLLYSREDFKKAYDNRFKDLVLSGLLDAKSFDSIVDSYKANIQDLIPTQVDKYGFPKSMTEWIIEMDRLKYNFSKRAKAATTYLEPD